MWISALLGRRFCSFQSIKSSKKRKSQLVSPFSDVLYQVKREDIKQKVILIQEAIFLLLFPSGDMVKAPYKQSGRIYCIIDALLWLWLDYKSSLGGRGTVFVWLPQIQVFFLLERHLELLKAFRGDLTLLSAFLFNKFLPQNCKVCDTDVKFVLSSHVCVSFSASLTGSHPDGNKPRGEAAPTENYESTIPLLLKGKDPRPLSQLRTRVRALITSSLTFHLCFPRTVMQC